ncbi:ras association domain-containing protein 6 [Aplochiton taeniatus]
MSIGPRAEFLSLINTYNCFLKDKTQLHLSYSQIEGEVVVEGVLNILWGVQRPIRLKIQDDKQSNPFAGLLLPDTLSPVSPLGGKRGMTRWGEFDNLHHIDEIEESNPECVEVAINQSKVPKLYESSTLGPDRTRVAELEAESTLFRCMSDASLVKRRRRGVKTAAQRERERQHRFSINGHFYNYKTSIFTPSYATPTKVRITTKMTTHHVIQQLMHKFKIENDPHEFALYCIHQSGEKRKLVDSDHPLWERILQGPSDDIMNMFLMDTDEQEVSNDVAQYLNLELPILEHILLKLHEEESREIQNTVSRYNHQQRLLSQYVSSKISPHIETSV